MKTIMLVCNAGMSTSMLVTKMEKAAASQGVEAKILLSLFPKWTRNLPAKPSMSS